MSFTYSLNPNQVLAAAEDILSSSRRIKEALDTMDGNLQQYLAMWTGEDRNQYAILKTKWDGLMQDMTGILDKAAPTLESMVNNIHRTERQITGLFQH
jgi:WXG100 family type VII secretion target